jgi:hypothetical protein
MSVPPFAVETKVPNPGPVYIQTLQTVPVAPQWSAVSMAGDPLALFLRANAVEQVVTRFGCSGVGFERLMYAPPCRTL